MLEIILIDSRDKLRINKLLFFMSSSMKDFLDKFFNLCREYQEEIPPQKMAEILRDYANRLDG
tara:strand:- start:683 stop:871 length:189 start_codon:yes stop_codon:yes gene_type:complete